MLSRLYHCAVRCRVRCKVNLLVMVLLWFKVSSAIRFSRDQQQQRNLCFSEGGVYTVTAKLLLL